MAVMAVIMAVCIIMAVMAVRIIMAKRPKSILILSLFIYIYIYIHTRVYVVSLPGSGNATFCHDSGRGEGIPKFQESINKQT